MANAIATKVVSREVVLVTLNENEFTIGLKEDPGIALLEADAAVALDAARNGGMD